MINKKIIGVILTIIIHSVLAFFIYTYARIACSTMEDNLLHVNFEPSGIQMLYYDFVAPIFLLLSIVMYCFKRILMIGVGIRFFPLIIWIVFFCFITYVDRVIHFPYGNIIFYQGSLSIAFVFFMINLIITYRQTYKIINYR